MKLALLKSTLNTPLLLTNLFFAFFMLNPLSDALAAQVPPQSIAFPPPVSPPLSYLDGQYQSSASLASSLFLSNVSSSQGQESSLQPTTDETELYNCTVVSLQDHEAELLTKEEKIALLEGTLYESIDKYSSCVNQVSANANTGSTGNGGGSGAGSTGQGDLNGEGASENVEQGGQATDGSENKSQSQNGVISDESINSSVPKLPPSESVTPAKRGVIAPKDNDKIICKLLFQEIQTTKDTVMLKGLKEQYANYQCG